jgi:hypothetical protein
MNYFENCTSLDQAKEIFKNLSFEFHPDVSGYDSTADFQELLNQFDKFKPSKEKFDGEFEQWNAAEYAAIIDQLLQIEEITISVCGSFIWLSGNTYPVKDQIKAVETGESMSRHFAPKKKQWYFKPADYKIQNFGKTMEFEQIKNKYGEQKVTRKPKPVLT